jgi:hypothetical protein
MTPFAEIYHPNRLKRDREEYQHAAATDARFQKESISFPAVPRMVRRAPGLPFRDLSQVEWEQETKDTYGIRDGFFFLTGGICWPTYVDQEGLVGVSVLLALELSTMVVWLLSERKFITIERTDEYPADAPTPLYPWLRSAMRYYRVKRIYQCQEDAVLKKFRPPINRAFPANKRPAFIRFPWNDLNTSIQTLQEYVALDRFRYFESRLQGEMQAYDAIPDGTYPALHATCVCLSGLDRLINNEYNIKELLRKIEEA